MTASVQHFLNSFDALSASEQHEAAVALLRRMLRGSEQSLADDALLEAADELFQELDAREAADGQS